MKQTQTKPVKTLEVDKTKNSCGTRRGCRFTGMPQYVKKVRVKLITTVKVN